MGKGRFVFVFQDFFDAVFRHANAFIDHECFFSYTAVCLHDIHSLKNSEYGQCQESENSEYCNIFYKYFYQFGNVDAAIWRVVYYACFGYKQKEGNRQNWIQNTADKHKRNSSVSATVVCYALFGNALLNGHMTERV